jgi:hypothetical protein
VKYIRTISRTIYLIGTPQALTVVIWHQTLLSHSTVQGLEKRLGDRHVKLQLRSFHTETEDDAESDQESDQDSAESESSSDEGMFPNFP